MGKQLSPFDADDENPGKHCKQIMGLLQEKQEEIEELHSMHALFAR